MRINKLALAACLTLLSLPALADEVYTYTGNAMGTTFVPGGGYTATNMITGSFTTASPLGANLALADISFLSYSFTDGDQTMTNLNSVEYLPPDFEIGTDASGNIISWNITLNIPSTLDFINTSNSSDPLIGVQDNGQVGIEAILGAVGNSGTPGTWTKSEVAATATPEPSSFMMLGTGLLGAFGLARRRFNV
jgi:hypothetical protein